MNFDVELTGKFCYFLMMPTKLFTKEQYLTPEEFIDLLKNHFEQLPADKLFMPMVAYTSCDKENRETVIFHKKSNTITHGLRMSKEKRKYADDFCMRTIVRDKSKVN